MRSLAVRCIAAAVVGAGAGYSAGIAPAAEPGARVALSATKFDFSMREIRVRKGETVTLVLTSPDFIHGFSVPDLNVRTDIVPGEPVELAITPQKAGRFTFLCDNFCGERHDEMSGTLIVTD